MFEGIRSRIESKIAAAALETSPFPHLIIEEFFPDDVYAKIQEYNRNCSRSPSGSSISGCRLRGELR
jgi:hypothetical protein